MTIDFSGQGGAGHRRRPGARLRDRRGACIAAGATVASTTARRRSVERGDRAARWRRAARSPPPPICATRRRAAQAVAPALDAPGGLDILVNNAAVNIEKPIEETDDAHWDLHLAVVLKAQLLHRAGGACRCSPQAAGSVVNIASELGLQAIANNVAYVAAKHGLVAHDPRAGDRAGAAPAFASMRSVPARWTPS